MKILCIPYSHTLSHLSRPLAVAHELRRRGHEVLFAGESGKTDLIRQESFPVLPLHEPDPDTLFGNIRRGRLRFVSAAELQTMLDADRVLLDQVRPDLVLSDGRFSARVSCATAGVRHAAIVNVSSTAHRALPYVPIFDRVPAAAGGRLRRLLNRINLGLEMQIFDRSMAEFTRLSRRYRLKQPVTATNCLAGNDLTLLPDLPRYFPSRRLPGTYHYVGPLTWKPSLSAPTWWPPRSGPGPLVYFTMGSTGLDAFFSRVTGMVRDLSLTAVVSTGGHRTEQCVAGGNLFMTDYLDGDQVMARADLMVCHGGNGSIYQALGQGKPVIGIPTIPDQAFNMRRVEALGCGRTLKWETFVRNPASLLSLIHQVHQSPDLYQSARELRRELEGFTASVTAAHLIEELHAR